MKKLALFSVIPAMLLASCSKFNPYGTYEFRLGKTDGSHLEVSASLLDEDYERVEGTKKMVLKADMGDEFSIAKMLDTYADKYPLIIPLVEYIKSQIENIDHIDLYYNVLEEIKDEKLGTRLGVGSDFFADLLKQIFPEIVEILGTDFSLTPDKTEYIFTTYINSKTLTFQIPVSVDDINMQLVWYGKYIDEDEGLVELPLESMPGPQGRARFGVHPLVKRDDYGNITYSEVAQVNTIFESDFSKTHLYTLDAESNEVEVGNFVVKTDAADHKQLYLYLNDGYKDVTTNIQGYIYEKNIHNEYSIKKNIQLSLLNGTLTNVVHNGKADREEGFIDEKGNEIAYSAFYQEPFVFRDFHCVKLGLTKI